MNSETNINKDEAIFAQFREEITYCPEPANCSAQVKSHLKDYRLNLELHDLTAEMELTPDSEITMFRNESIVDESGKTINQTIYYQKFYRIRKYKKNNWTIYRKKDVGYLVVTIQNHVIINFDWTDTREAMQYGAWHAFAHITSNISIGIAVLITIIFMWVDSFDLSYLMLGFMSYLFIFSVLQLLFLIPAFFYIVIKGILYCVRSLRCGTLRKYRIKDIQEYVPECDCYNFEELAVILGKEEILTSETLLEAKYRVEYRIESVEEQDDDLLVSVILYFNNTYANDYFVYRKKEKLHYVLDLPIFVFSEKMMIEEQLKYSMVK